MNNCKTCRHWVEAEYERHNARRCNYVVMLWDSFKWSKDGESRVLLPKYAKQKAFVQDGSDYKANLFTMEDFGCNQWVAV